MPRRGWLVDNQVPRSVTRVLRSSGYDTVEVRTVLGADAPDAAITAYAEATGRWVVTKDRDFAARRRAVGQPTLWLRTLQTEEESHLRNRLAEVIAAVGAGANQLTLTRDGALEIEP